MYLLTLLWITGLLLLVDPGSSAVEDLHLTWYAPFYSGGGYSSEAFSLMLALDMVGFSNFSVGHHGDSFRPAFYGGLTDTERDTYHGHDVVNRRLQASSSDMVDIEVCHSEPGAWHAPSPKYNTVRCPTTRRNLMSSGGRRRVVPYNIGRTMFETDRIPDGWVSRLNYMDEVWVPTEFARDIFERAGVAQQKLVVVGEAVDSDFYQPSDYHNLTDSQRSDLGLPPLEMIAPYRTVFLFVGKFETRKGLRHLLRAYFDAFAMDEDGRGEVLLLILTSAYHSNEDLYADLNALMVKERLSVEYVPQHPRYLVLTAVKQRGMPYMYSLASALVIPSHGEGWGRPHLEAMSCGTPVLATGWSGPTAFIRHGDTGYLIDIEPELIPAEGWTGHRWAQPSLPHLTQLLRLVHDAPQEVAAVGARARREVLARYTLEALGRQVLAELTRIRDKLLPGDATQVAGHPHQGGEL